MANRPEVIPDLEPVKSQVLDVNPALDYAQPGPYVLQYMHATS